jgi:two-component system, NtrC family, sensor kinase
MSLAMPVAQSSRNSARNIPRVIRLRRWWLLPLVLWALGSGLYYTTHLTQIRAQTTAIAIEGARNMFRMVVLTRNWNSSHGGIYVPVTPRTQPNPYLEHPRRDVMTTDGVALTMLNPAYMTRLIGEMAELNAGVIFRLTSLRPMRPANAPDAWEARALQGFEQGMRESWAVEDGKEEPLLRYMAPLAVQESCLACHARQGYKLGDVRGGISVSQKYAPIEQVVALQQRETLIATLSTFLLISGLGWLLLELLRRRWLELASKIQEVEDTQRQLLQSEKLASIGQLAAGVAHEINNPVGFVNSNLGSLRNYSQQMIALLEQCRNGQASEADFRAVDFDYLRSDVLDLLQESQDGLLRVTRIVNDLKDFSRVDRAEEQDFDLNSGLESTLNVVWNELKYKAEVIRDYGEIPLLRCVGAQINQVAMNLLLNAAHAIAEHGTITLRSGHDADTVWFEVIDSGSGIAPEVLSRIFEPFFTTRPVGKGTGLGLSMSYDIVQKHGGRIEVSSQPGQGSSFRVSLPKTHQPTNPPAN